MADRRTFCAAAAALALGGCATRPAAPPAAAIAELGATGKLRAAINYGNPILANRGADGQPAGV
ncbi:MAG TPA: ABC transporter substrate-binding protein, partial [Ramlibacter sp.]